MAQTINYWIKPKFKLLLQKIKNGECIPFVGPEVCKPWIPLGNEIASKWAKDNNYPLQDSFQLSRVAQFLAIQEGKIFPMELLKSELKKVNPPDFREGQYRNTPLAVLADLNLPIYITTNYDHFIEEALRSRGKKPITDFCRWNEDLVNYANENKINSKLYDPDSGFEITSANPLVYHLHGDINHPDSIVLTEKDYIEFIIFLNKENETKVLPHGIRKKINKDHLLFIGYSLYDISFSVIFQTVINSGNANRGSVGISVQLMSITNDNRINVVKKTEEDREKAEEDKEKTIKYLEDYTKEMFNLYVYHGDVCKFSKELSEQLEQFQGL